MSITKYAIEIDTSRRLGQEKKVELAEAIVHLLQEYLEVGGELKFYDPRILTQAYIKPDKVTKYGNIHLSEDKEFRWR